ncbi:right-handed parallel beta-helix repeat-containing protein, partial [Dyadobacter sp. LHD-138]|uniref:right-handed parallel beta-helix repeat-containing protein n=1 Tax=Dyadobacter sp. LHD-138 TaxID=3071413 RepID=UPI0027E1559B
IKGKFIEDNLGGTFQLLRSHKNASDQSKFVQVGKLAFAAIQPGEVADDKTKRLAVVTPVGYVPYLSINQLRGGSADTARAVYITDPGRFGLFRLDPTDTSTPDDSAMVLVYSTKRFKRITDYVTPEMFGAKGDGVSDDRRSIQSALNFNSPTIQFSGTYLISGPLNIPSDKRLIGQESVITAPSGTFFTGLNINAQRNIYVEGLRIRANDGQDAFDYAIHINDSKNIEINRCQISNIGKEPEGPESGLGIYLSGSVKASPSGNFGCENIKITNNIITNIKGYGNVRGDFVLVTGSDNVIIDNNYFDTCRRQGIAVADYSTNIKITNNSIYNTYLDGIDVEPDTISNVGFITMLNNTIKNFGCKPGSTIGVQFYGIDCHKFHYNVDITGNTIIAKSANALAGINCENGSGQIKIIGNTIEGNNLLANGIVLYSGSGARDLIIANNVVKGFKMKGIDGFYNGFLTITGNRVESELGYLGIKSNESKTIVSDNFVSLSLDSAKVQGMVMYQTETKKVQNNVVQVKNGDAYSFLVTGGYHSPGSTFFNNAAINLGSGKTGYKIDISGSAPGFTFMNNYADASFVDRALPERYAITAENGTSIPVTGYYVKGSTVTNLSPTAGGNVGWICVVSGSPGTWKAFGAIAP